MTTKIARRMKLSGTYGGDGGLHKSRIRRRTYHVDSADASAREYFDIQNDDALLVVSAGFVGIDRLDAVAANQARGRAQSARQSRSVRAVRGWNAVGTCAAGPRLGIVSRTRSGRFIAPGGTYACACA